MDSNEQLIKEAYEAFNTRNIPAVLSLMHADVHWPNGWEGGYVEGHAQVSDYCTRQWKELNPLVIPVLITRKEDGRYETTVNQTVTDMQGNIVFEGLVKHIYVIKSGLISTMEIEKV